MSNFLNIFIASQIISGFLGVDYLGESTEVSLWGIATYYVLVVLLCDMILNLLSEKSKEEYPYDCKNWQTD